MTASIPLVRDPRSFQFDRPPEWRPDKPPRLIERWWPGMREASQNVSSSRGGDPRELVQVLVIHATAGDTSAGACSVTFAGKASFHWLIPDEDEGAHGRHVWATAPEARAAWHVRNACRHESVCGGRDRLNQVSLGVEIVNRAAPGDPYSVWQVEAAAAIARYAWVKYPRLIHVVSHARLDPSRRSDPGPHFPWERFQALTLGDLPMGEVFAPQ